ncbi:Chromosome condensation complex Condensin, subunit D2 [Pseudoloma neurophilia]|uniref:Chromosome condensation complex Condensin, subunit D2 n=1 Tax=Pseudoloma neurophilia TaxID=146866 RepID=A0A0R0M2P8_9MICR|nr:Chromosome condensation complex Condensin, subunit D2 [Pseudoloma neurophilia]
MNNIFNLKNKKISEAYAEYHDAIEESENSNRMTLLKMIFQGGKCDEEMFTLLHLLVKKCDINEKEIFFAIFSHICTVSVGESELSLIIKIVFHILELMKKASEKENSKIYQVLQYIIKEIETSKHDLLLKQFLNSFIILLSSVDISDLCISIFKIFLKHGNRESRETLFETKNGSALMAVKCVDMVFESIENDNNTVFQKNCSIFLSEIAGLCPEIFLEKDFNDHENHSIRNTHLDIYFHIIMLLKASDNPNIKNQSEDAKSSIHTLMNEYLDLILERLLDVNHFVRSKAIFHLTHLLQKNVILIKKRQQVISLVLERIKDKSVLVRKKAIQFCQAAVENHPFASNKYLIKIEEDNNGNKPEKLEKKQLAENKMAYVKDLNTFIDQMTEVIVTIMNIFPALRGETVDIIDFARICVLLKLPKCLQFIDFLCKNIDDKHKGVLLEALIDIIQTLKDDEDDLFNFFLSIDEPFLKTLSKKHIIDKKFLKSLMKQFENKSNIVKSSLLLKKICTKRYNGDYFDIAIKYVKEDESPVTIKTYKNILEIIKLKPFESHVKKRLSVKNSVAGQEPEKIEPSDCTKAIDVLVNTKTVDFDLIDITVRLIYRTTEPHAYVRTLLNRLVESESIIKLIYCVGSIALNEAFYIDKMEKNIPAIMVPDEIKERRRSFNVSRTSFRNSINESFNKRNSNIYGDESLEDSYIQPITVIRSQTGLENKSDEEIKDILFYIKEKEIFYGKNSLLAPFVKLVIKNTEGPLQVPAMISTFRMMAVSSEFFLKYHHIFINGLRSKNNTIVYNSIIALADYILLYNCYTEKYASMLFDKLFVIDTEPEKKESEPDFNQTTVTADEIVELTLFIINYLISSKILKIKGYGSILCRLFDTHTEELKSILQEVRSDENAISSLFYEVLLEELNVVTETQTTKRTTMSNVIHFLKDLMKEKTKENLFIRILRKHHKDGKYTQILNLLYKTLSFNPKNISNMRTDAIFGQWIETK